MRILCIDYGKKRCGLAVTDPLQLIATHLAAVATQELMPYIEQYCLGENVEGFVLGKPLTLNNELNAIALDIDDFKLKLKSKFPDKYIDEIDERFTSKLASQSILQSGASKKTRRDKSLVDMVSAVIILQNYLTLKENNFR